DDQAAVSAPRTPGGASRPIRVRAATSLLEHVADANISPDKGKGDAQASPPDEEPARADRSYPILPLPSVEW
ncbi:unnamed protein product, partial [Musa textilis]